MTALSFLFSLCSRIWFPGVFLRLSDHQRRWKGPSSKKKPQWQRSDNIVQAIIVFWQIAGSYGKKLIAKLIDGPETGEKEGNHWQFYCQWLKSSIQDRWFPLIEVLKKYLLRSFQGVFCQLPKSRFFVFMAMERCLHIFLKGRSFSMSTYIFNREKTYLIANYTYFLEIRI